MQIGDFTLDGGHWQGQLERARRIAADEEVLLEAGASSFWSGLLSLTPKRLLFIRKRKILLGFQVKSWSWSELKAVRLEAHADGQGVDLVIERAGATHPDTFSLFGVNAKQAAAMEREVQYRIDHSDAVG